MTGKHILPFAIGILLLFLVLPWLARIRSGRYSAEAMVIASPYTNAYFDSSFGKDVMRTIPTVQHLRVTPSFAAKPAPGIPTLTNGTAIFLTAVGPTAADAQLAANRAAAQLGGTVSNTYGGTVRILVARSPWQDSYLDDTLLPALKRQFNY